MERNGGATSSTSPVAISTISFVSWFGSRGRFGGLLILDIWHGACSFGRGDFKLTHYLPARSVATGAGTGQGAGDGAPRTADGAARPREPLLPQAGLHDGGGERMELDVNAPTVRESPVPPGFVARVPA